MKALSILALAVATFAAPMAFAGQKPSTSTQVAGPMTSVQSSAPVVNLTLTIIYTGEYLSFDLGS